MLRVILFFFISLSVYASDWVKVAEEVKDSIPVIITSGRICSAALIDSNKILTAAHCVDTLRQVHINFRRLKTKELDKKSKSNAKSKNQNQYNVYTGYVSAIDNKYDIAIVTIDKKLDKYKPLKVLEKEKDLKMGDDISTIGHPTMTKMFSTPVFDDSMTYLMSSGIVSKNVENEIITDMSLSPGNSGGPVFNNNSELVGVVSRKRADKFVGNIGMLANHKIVAKLRENDKSKELSWTKSKGGGFFNLGWMNDSYLAELNEAGHSVDQTPMIFNIGFKMFDRLFFNYSSDLFNSDLKYYQWDFGYKFHIDLDSQAALSIGLSYAQVKYGFHETSVAEKIGNGFKLIFQHSAMPLGLTYGNFKVDGKNYYNIGFVFGMML